MTKDELEKVWESIRGKKLLHPAAKHGPWVVFDRRFNTTIFGEYSTGRLCIEFLSVAAKWQFYVDREEELEYL